MEQNDTKHIEANEKLTDPRPNAEIGSGTEPISDSLGSVATWCKKCRQAVIPQVADPHRCPHCRRFLRSNAAHAKDPVNEARQHDLLQKFTRDFEPATEAERVLVRLLARISARLDVVKNIGEQARMAQTMTTLIGSLKAAKADRPASVPTDEQLMNLSPVEFAAAARRLADDAEALVQREAEMAQSITEQRAAEDAARAAKQQETERQSASSPEQMEELDNLLAAIVTVPICPHCHTDISHIEPGTPRVEHMLACARRHEDPEVRQRREQANAEMLESLRRGGL
jgi:Zn finger protein HypA/HybF involved in hydrogenase expression